MRALAQSKGPSEREPAIGTRQEEEAGTPHSNDGYDGAESTHEPRMLAPCCVCSPAVTTILINDPNGSWICNDDFDGTHPSVTWTAPASGQYDIWVGTYGGGTAPADVFITEVQNGDPCGH